jgi:hypothetical protein
MLQKNKIGHYLKIKIKDKPAKKFKNGLAYFFVTSPKKTQSFLPLANL